MATEKIKAKRLHICDWCIGGMRSHGEEIFVGDRLFSWQIEEENLKCDFCNEDDFDELFNCLIKD